MGLAETYGAIAATTLTSTGSTLITGDCGTCPGTSITGFPPSKCTGITSAGRTAACNAEAACLSAYNNAQAVTPTIALSVPDLGGLTLGPGAYTFPHLRRHAHWNAHISNWATKSSNISPSVDPWYTRLSIMPSCAYAGRMCHLFPRPNFVTWIGEEPFGDHPQRLYPALPSQPDSST
ncbi:hypothetical protein V501_00724 [Pseudogymnoascus sp. VKM F-4519 (FW-2642)]|nr:hypothetical protein V501_00724 [Pseudogymnoascus sp. VKM F-4519 (FW-2642)]